MDQLSAVEKGFLDELAQLSHNEPAVTAGLDQIPEEEALDLGRRGARAALAPLIWAAAVGDRWGVRRTAEFLGVSRQALYKRLRSGSLLGVQGRGTTWFPVWQFAPDQHIVRPVAGAIVQAFRDADPEVDPLVIAAWATTSNRLLGDMSPAAWVVEDRGDDPVVRAARRAAAGLAA